MMKNLCIVISNVDRSIAFEWITDGLRDRYNISFILIGEKGTYLSRFLSQRHVPYCEIPLKKKRQIFSAIYKILIFLRKQKADIVHTHLVEASVTGLFAAWLTGIKKRIYTRHHSDYNYKYSPKGIKYDRFCNFFASDIVAISRQVKDILIEKEKVPARKITLVHHGFDLNYYAVTDSKRVESVKQKYNPSDKSPVIGVIARQTHWKGIQYIIPAFASLQKEYPDALLLLANAHGDYKPEIDRLLSSLLPEDSYLCIKFEYDTPALYQLMDIYVHTPVDDVVEAFGQTYIEALAAGVPCVFTLSGIATEFIEADANAVVVPYQNSESVYTGMSRILGNEKLRNNLITNGKISVEKEFGLTLFLEKLSALYG